MSQEAGKDALEHETEAARAAYEGERSRRDSVRAGLAVPLAALSFAAVGFGNLAANFRWIAEPGALAWLSAAVAACAAVSLGALGWAVRLIRKVDTVGQPIDPERVNFRARVQEFVEFLRDRVGADGDDGEARLQAIALERAREALNDAYYDCYRRLAEENRRNLRIQRTALGWLLLGLFLLLAAIFLSGAARQLEMIPSAWWDVFALPDAGPAAEGREGP